MKKKFKDFTIGEIIKICKNSNCESCPINNICSYSLYMFIYGYHNSTTLESKIKSKGE